MQRLRHLTLAVTLALTFALPASAGEIECGIAGKAPCFTSAPTDEVTEPTDETRAGVLEAVSALLQSVLSVF